MSRLLLLVAIATVVYLLLRSFRNAAPRQNMTVTEDMVRCVHCGVHLPKSESVMTDGRFFCSLEHRDAFRKKN